MNGHNPKDYYVGRVVTLESETRQLKSLLEAKREQKKADRVKIWRFAAFVIGSAGFAAGFWCGVCCRVVAKLIK
jgi:hypothetical protein